MGQNEDITLIFVNVCLCIAEASIETTDRTVKNDSEKNGKYKFIQKRAYQIYQPSYFAIIPAHTM